MSHVTSSGRRRAAGLLSAALLAAGLVAGIGVATAPSATAATPCIPLPIPLSGLPICELSAQQATGISGTPKVGLDLTAVNPTWDDDTATTDSYQWQRDGVAIAGETAQTYTVMAADVDHDLTLIANGSSNLGLTTASSTSAAVKGLKGDAPTPTTDAPITIKVTNGVRPGGTLTVDPGTWTGDQQPAFSYQWYRTVGRGATPIASATGSSYTMTASDVGHRLAAVVTAKRDGYQDGAALSPVVTVPKTRTTIAFTLAKKSIHRGERGRGRVLVRAIDHSAPTGTLVLRDGRRQIKTYRLSTPNDGALTLSLPKLAPGRHVLGLTYTGNGALAPVTSKKATLRVH